MPSTDNEAALLGLFHPHFLQDRAAIGAQRFAYYTTAETAAKIIDSGEVWLRNARVMNDHSEIHYGLERARAALSGPAGDSIFATIESIFPGVRKEVEARLRAWEQHWASDTYLACLSQHDPSEDLTGRLSMWRAYGDVALVINGTPFAAETDQLGAYSAPVHYLDQTDLNGRWQVVAAALPKYTDILCAVGREKLTNLMVFVIHLAAIGTKHPGFKEEREWRVFFSSIFSQVPDEHSALTKKIVTIDGVSQRVVALPLSHDPDRGLFDADIPSLLDRVIIGPTSYPSVQADAFIQLLSDAGVDNAKSKVIVSDIPLRNDV